MVLGGGSNMLVSDRGFDGVVFLTTGLDRLEALGDDRYRVEGGVELDRLVQEVMLDRNYDGVGGLTGIPGTVGGAIFMNAGTVNGSTCQLLESAEVVGPDGLRTVSIEPSLYSYPRPDLLSPAAASSCGARSDSPLPRRISARSTITTSNAARRSSPKATAAAASSRTRPTSMPDGSSNLVA